MACSEVRPGITRRTVSIHSKAHGLLSQHNCKLSPNIQATTSLCRTMDSQAPYSSIFENYDLYSEPAASTFPLPEVSLASTEMNLDAGSSPFRTHGPRAQPATGPSSSFQEGDLQVPYATPSPFRSDLLDIQPTHTLSEFFFFFSFLTTPRHTSPVIHLFVARPQPMHQLPFHAFSGPGAALQDCALQAS